MNQSFPKSVLTICFSLCSLAIAACWPAATSNGPGETMDTEPTSSSRLLLMVSGPANRTIQIQYLDTWGEEDRWQVLTDLILPDSPLTILDTTSDQVPMRFYRAINLGLSPQELDVVVTTDVTLALLVVRSDQVKSSTVVIDNELDKTLGLSVKPVVRAPPTVATQPQDKTVTVGDNVTFTVVATGSAPLVYQWRFNGTNLSRAKSAVLDLKRVTAAQAGLYTVVVSNAVGVVESAPAILRVKSPPVITVQPPNQTNAVGTMATLTVGVLGTEPLFYQWQFNGTNLVGATDSGLKLNSIHTNQAGIYTVVVSNHIGKTISSPAKLIVLVPPTFVAQPQDKTVTVGDKVKVTVVASGSAPLSYQWRFNGTNLSRAKSAVLDLKRVTAAQAGTYTVVVSNAVAVVESAPAILRVKSPPVIMVQPKNWTNAVGTTATFSVEVLGTEPLSYQWRFNGMSLVGETNATLTLTNVRPDYAGIYTVLVSNAVGVVTSKSAILKIKPWYTGHRVSKTNISSGGKTGIEMAFWVYLDITIGDNGTFQGTWQEYDLKSCWEYTYGTVCYYKNSGVSQKVSGSFNPITLQGTIKLEGYGSESLTVTGPAPLEFVYSGRYYIRSHLY
jgi:hypothetical protein